MTGLKWLERSLFLCAVALAAWCSVVLLRAEYVRHLPIPPPHRASSASAERDDRRGTARTRTQLPGDENPAGTSADAPIDAGAWMARLDAPSIGLMTTVLEGSDDGILARAAGHIEGTALPDSGGNVGIAGHRDTIFRPLRRVRVGDRLRLTTVDRVSIYEVSRTEIVAPSDVGVLAPSAGPTLTLVTCYPFTFIGAAPKRFIVHANLIEQRER